MQLAKLANLHPALQSTSAKRVVVSVSILRSILIGLSVALIAQMADLGTPILWLIVGSTIGVCLGAYIAFTRLTTLGFLLTAIASSFAYLLLSGVTNYLLIVDRNRIFLTASLFSHIDVIYYLALGLAIMSFLFWRYPATLSFEVLGLASCGVSLVAAHRNFRFDMPQFVNTLAWRLGLEHLSTLIAVGALIVVIFIGYLWAATLPGRPVARWSARPTIFHRKGLLISNALILILCLASIVVILWSSIYARYAVVAASVTTNGVGQESDAGLTPLGFHSALGSNNQPAALLRLEGDYSQNPHQPMLYLREGALSEFNGSEMVIAESNYDKDVAHKSVDQSFQVPSDPALPDRLQVVQSIYLLAQHNNSFAIDYPISMRSLRNPNPGRFKSAYRAYSLAPVYKLDSLFDKKVGDARWSSRDWQHYLKTHSDIRYQELAKKVSATTSDPLLKAQAIVEYLNETAIYTLTPKHQVAAKEDKVAPFLFGDHRGYCVHFAHAMVYMFRSLGLPARIGTGYLTDLSQAKDGHTLLRMSDRHAWAEVYVQNHGWVVYDVQPEQVENHADMQVDLKLLEELMGMLDPGEEILPKDSTKDEPALSDQNAINFPIKELLISLLITLLISFTVLKLYLRYCYLIPGSAQGCIIRHYRAVVSRLYDLGFSRQMAETRAEYAARVQSSCGYNLFSLSEPATYALYSQQVSSQHTSRVIERFHQDLAELKHFAFWKRSLAFLNPASIFALLGGEEW